MLVLVENYEALLEPPKGCHHLLVGLGKVVLHDLLRIVERVAALSIAELIDVASSMGITTRRL